MILRLEVKNWSNLESFSTTFDKGCNLVIGPNFSGKSSLLNAIFFAITGKLPNELEPKDMIQKEKNEMTVQLDFVAKDGDTYRIRRYVKLSKTARQSISTHLYPLVNDIEQEEIASGNEATEKILECLNTELMLFKRSIFMTEGDVYRILTKRERGLREEIYKVLGIERIHAIAKIADKLKKELKKEKNALEKRLELGELGEFEKEDTGTIEEKLNEIDNRIAKIKEKINELTNEKSELNEKLNAYERFNKIEKDLEMLANKMKALTKGIPGEGNYKERLESYYNSRKEKLDNLKNEITSLEADIIAIEHRLKDLRDDLERLSAETSICPTCERPLTRQEAERIINKKKENISELEKELSKKKEALVDKRKAKRRLEDTISELSLKLTELNNALEEARELNEEKSKLMKEISRQSKSALMDHLSNIENELNNLDDEKNRLLEERGRLNAKLEFTKLDYDKIERDIRNLEHRVYILELFIKACKNTAERVSKELIRKIGDDVANVWKRLHGGIWQVEISDNLQPILKRDASEYLPMQLSGAEKMILFIALRAFTAEYLGNPGFLIFDEPFEHLDPENRVFLKDFLLSLSNDGIEQIIISSCDEKLLEEKWNKIIELKK
ncbi:MAG: hypothetical protein J7L47_03265 [Candidatus Odinarchaeota archaeon]|nr:hypothetical protein [Candidatus Odinarchaeota archaeon]